MCFVKSLLVLKLNFWLIEGVWGSDVCRISGLWKFFGFGLFFLDLVLLGLFGDKFFFLKLFFGVGICLKSSELLLWFFGLLLFVIIFNKKGMFLVVELFCCFWYWLFKFFKMVMGFCLFLFSEYVFFMLVWVFVVFLFVKFWGCMWEDCL